MVRTNIFCSEIWWEGGESVEDDEEFYYFFIGRHYCFVIDVVLLVFSWSMCFNSSFLKGDFWVCFVESSSDMSSEI